MKGVLTDAILAIAGAARTGGDVLAAAADAARRITGARAALCVVSDGAWQDARVSGIADDALVPRSVRALEVIERLGIVARVELSPGDGATGVLAVLDAPATPELEALAAHVSLTIAHQRLVREAHSTRSIYRTLVEQLPAVTYYRPLDMPGTPSYASPQMESLIGYSAAELNADPDRWKKRIHPDDVVRVLSEQATYRPELQNTPLRAEYRMVHKDGRTVWIENYALAVRDDAGRARFVLGLLYDVTERKQLEEQLRHAQKMEAVGKLAGGIAHDFNNLLSVVLSYGQSLVADLVEGDPRRNEVREIVKAGERARALTQQLLAFSRRQMLAPKVLELGHVASAMRTFLRRLLGEDIELVVNASRSRARVKADPTQVEQVLMNLAVNARDAMPDGGVLTITIEDVKVDATGVGAQPGLAPGGYVRLAVSDTGIGLDAETRGRVFEPFFTTKDKTRNSGLGLSTALGIAEQSGGTISVTSTPGAGATFALWLPVTEDIEPAPRPTPSTGLPRGTETVLLAEDDEQVRHLVHTLLERLGYKVLPCEHGDHAIAMASAHEEPIDLLLTDVVMPRMNGFELARQMSTLRPSTRILFMSGYNEEAVSRHGPPSGATIIAKPFSVSELARQLRAILDEARSAR